MKTNHKYNGYANYETWAVALWLGNEEGTYRYWRDAARELKERVAPRSRCVIEGVLTAEEQAKNLLVPWLEEKVTEDAPGLPASLYSDLLTEALSKVDWHEVAETFLED